MLFEVVSLPILCLQIVYDILFKTIIDNYPELHPDNLHHVFSP
jgi:hypothetical protein